ncbi:MAG: alpha/beta hydrolase [Actinomycetes bacterium]
MPSLTAQLVRRSFVTALCLARSRAGSTQITGDSSAEDLARVALAMREQTERLATVGPQPRGITVTRFDGPVPGDEVAHGRQVDSDRVVLHLHGGGYFMCSPATHRGMAVALSRTARARVVLPAYRLAPEDPFPAAVDDAVAAYRHLLERGEDPSRIAVTGDSAGGGLALSLLVRARDEGLPMPACYAGMSPWTDLTGSGDSMRDRDAVDPWLKADQVPPAALAYAGDAPLDHPLVSPLFADLTGLPPMLVHVGSDEILHSDAERLVARARAAGVDASLGVFDGLWHVFHAFPLPESRHALREIGAFVRRHTDAVRRTAAGRSSAA